MSGHSWDMPVVLALDAVEQLPGFRPDQIEWASFRFWRSGMGEQMEWASIYAHRTRAERGLVRFSVREGEFTVTDQHNRALSANEVADVLNVPAVSAEKAVTLVIAALATALARYNATHAPHTAAHAVTTRQGPVGSYSRRDSLADQRERSGIGR